MTLRPTPRPPRRSGLGGRSAAAWPALRAAPPVVTMLGDSITAGYGLPAAAALPAQLQAALARLGRPARVRGAGVSGDTTADGLARVDFSVQSDTRLCVVALGGNDLLQGLEPAQTRANLTRIVARLKARRIGVLIAGLQRSAGHRRGLRRRFRRASSPPWPAPTGAALYPDLLAGVAGMPALNQRDGIHPNAARRPDHRRAPGAGDGQGLVKARR